MNADQIYQAWRTAVRNDNRELAAQAREDLLALLDRGIEPEWTHSQRLAFFLASVLP